MERTIYINNTIPSDDQLNNTETSRANSINKRFRASCQMGVISGFRITISADPTKLDIGVGSGFTGG
jgi:hypothetical protein